MGARHQAWLISVFLVETGFHLVDQDGLDPLTSLSTHLGLPKCWDYRHEPPLLEGGVRELSVGDAESRSRCGVELEVGGDWRGEETRGELELGHKVEVQGVLAEAWGIGEEEGSRLGPKRTHCLPGPWEGLSWVLSERGRFGK